MAIPIVQVDAFTSTPFRGNPAAVCVLDHSMPDAWMQAVAAEMNLSETVFLQPRGTHAYDIRWFTPTNEVPLCGHATLAAAHVLWERGDEPPRQRITFCAAVGPLAAEREDDWIRLDFPALPVTPCSWPAEIADALGAGASGAYRNAQGVYLVELPDERAVRAVTPDFARLRERGRAMIIVTAAGGSGGCDFVSRFFAPGDGIDEDPVTGSAHCSLGPFWAERLGRTELVGHQVSPRGGVVRVRVRNPRVDLLGQAVTVFAGALSDPAANV